MPLAIATREDIAGYAAALAPLGLETIAMPVTRTEPPRDRHALLRAVEAGGYIAIVVASQRAAMALLDARGHAPLPEIWAIGAATASVLEQAHLHPIVPAGGDAVALARALVAQRPIAGKRVLVPRAEDGREDGIGTLRDAGAEVDAIVAYRTVPVSADEPAIASGKAALAAGQAAIAVVFAPSQVAALDALVGVRKTVTRWVAIGETTAQALRDAGAEVIAVAATPTPEGIANAAAAVYPLEP
jgi:uroporphyrinogen-III synthase